LVKYDGKNWIVFNSSNSGLPDNTVTSIAVGADGVKWIGTYKGIVKFESEDSPAFDAEQGGIWTVYNSLNSALSIDMISSISVDGKIIWIGTGGSGLVKFSPQKKGEARWVIYGKSNSKLNDNMINFINIDQSGEKWIGTWGGGLVVY